VTPLFLRFNASKVTLSGLAGGEYLPLTTSKGPAFPCLVTLDGYPTPPADCAQKQRNPFKKVRKLQIIIFFTQDTLWAYGEILGEREKD
jgi:hypothetical protein